MTRLLWTTDPHLNHAPARAWDRWVGDIVSRRPDAVVITGDISEGDDVAFQLRRIAEAVGVDIYFVLGNHDFYQSSLDQARDRIIRQCREHTSLCYLTDMPPVELRPGVFLIGEDGWGDATEGDYEGSPVRLNDFAMIEDFATAEPHRWKTMLQEQGRLSARRLVDKLAALPDTTRQVLIATHVPPFRESCWYMGKTTDDDWAPFFVCGQVGQAVLQHCQSHGRQHVTVLCGHTHHEGVAAMRENLIVYTGAADYARPDVEATWVISQDSVIRES